MMLADIGYRPIVRFLPYSVAVAQRVAVSGYRRPNFAA